jgi:hypothetical protein
MTNWLIFDRWTVFFVALGVWALIGLPLWWMSVAFGAPVFPLPAPRDLISIIFLVAFYPSLLLMVAIVFASARIRQTNRKARLPNA